MPVATRMYALPDVVNAAIAAPIVLKGAVRVPVPPGSALASTKSASPITPSMPSQFSSTYTALGLG